MTLIPDYLMSWWESERQIATDAGEVLFLGVPDKWFDDPNYFCENGHVSKNILSGDDGDRCLACMKPTIIGPPIREQEFALVLEHLRKESE